MSVAAVVLAAGGGTRFSANTSKLVAPFRGRALVTWAVTAALDAGLDEVVVVVGARGDAVRALLPAGVTVLANGAWQDGIASSLRRAIAHAQEAGHDAVLVGLGDQPLVTAEAFRRVGGFDERPIGVATYDGQRRNPVRLAASIWSLVPDSGDEGMRSVMRLRPDLVGEVPCPGQGVDIDTVADLEQWSEISAPPPDQEGS